MKHTPFTNILGLFTVWACCSLSVAPAHGQNQSVARQWMEANLAAITLDGQGPAIHSRNLFHLTAAMHDAWAVYHPRASTFLLGKQHGDYKAAYEPIAPNTAGSNIDSLCEVTICYAAFRLLRHRYNSYSSKRRAMDHLENLLVAQGHNPNFAQTDYSKGNAAALGNYIAQCYIELGLQDGSNEESNHEALRYQPSNPSLQPNVPGTKLRNPNRWQPLSVRPYVLERGGDKTLPDWVRLLIFNEDVFANPEWGDVQPFSLTAADMQAKTNDGVPFNVYLDPGGPPTIGPGADAQTEAYRWGFMLNVHWSSHLDPADSVRINISPAARGNPAPWPRSFDGYPDFFDLKNGGVEYLGHKKNPATKKAYAPNHVLRADYTRVIAEYWVDAATTKSPPGHWVQLMLDASDHPDFEKRWMGKGKPLSDLEWDVRSLFAMGSAMHDAAIACWSVKGYYDYVRPISAIRWMAGNGQCSNPELPNYHEFGLPLVKNQVALVGENDALAGTDKEHVGKLKLYCWRGPEYIPDPKTSTAGVGWILAENWWPYQRFSFATPPFAGYVSGHSTFSTVGAEILTRITGNPFFPGGLLEERIPQNSFLEFEAGPSEDITLQWATYHDAANETCLSRIWGGIHPPCDDIPARHMAIKVVDKALSMAAGYMGK